MIGIWGKNIVCGDVNPSKWQFEGVLSGYRMLILSTPPPDEHNKFSYILKLFLKVFDF